MQTENEFKVENSGRGKVQSTLNLKPNSKFRDLPHRRLGVRSIYGTDHSFPNKQSGKHMLLMVTKN